MIRGIIWGGLQAITVGALCVFISGVSRVAHAKTDVLELSMAVYSDSKNTQTSKDPGAAKRHSPFRLPDESRSEVTDLVSKMDAQFSQCERFRASWQLEARKFELKGVLNQRQEWSAIIHIAQTDYWWAKQGEAYLSENVMVGLVTDKTATLHPTRMPKGCETDQWAVRLLTEERS